jgi:hypothetical protein
MLAVPINILDIYNIQILENKQELGHMPYCMHDMCVDVSNDERYKSISIV